MCAVAPVPPPRALGAIVVAARRVVARVLQRIGGNLGTLQHRSISALIGVLIFPILLLASTRTPTMGEPTAAAHPYPTQNPPTSRPPHPPQPTPRAMWPTPRLSP